MSVGSSRTDRISLHESLLSELVSRIVETVHPLRIVLFGSAARCEMAESSDIDILVIMPDGVHRRRTAQAVYRSLCGLGISKDVVVVTKSDVQDYSDNHSLVICPALKEGKEIYRAGG